MHGNSNSSMWLFVVLILFGWALPTKANPADDMKRHLTALDAELRQSLLNPPGRRIQEQTTVPTRTCDQVIEIVTAENIRAIGNIYIRALVPANQIEFVALLQQALLGTVTYDFQVSKQCSSCVDVATVNGDSLEGSGFDEYCGSDSYGYEAELSTLMFAPIDPSTGEVFKGKRLRAQLTMHGTTIDVRDAPTESFPANITETLSSLQSQAEVTNFLLSYTSLWSGMTSASSGAIALYPDFIGFGQSTDWNRTFLLKEPYMQSAAVAWLDANNQFNGNCSTSELEDAVTVTGFSEGGYAAVNAAVALDQLGTEVLALYAIAAPLNLEIQMMHLVGTFVKCCCFDCFGFGRGRLTHHLSSYRIVR
jgi:hypothetical protein